MNRRRLILLSVVLACVPLFGFGTPRCSPEQVRIVGTILKHKHPFLICVRAHESDHDDVNHNGLHDGGYQASNGTHFGAYQFGQQTWNNTAAHDNRPDLVGRDPRSASVVDQDEMAWHLYLWQGPSPWAGSGCY